MVNRCFSTGEKATEEVHTTSGTRAAAGCGDGAPALSVWVKAERCRGCVTHPGLQFLGDESGDYL